MKRRTKILIYSIISLAILSIAFFSLFTRRVNSVSIPDYTTELVGEGYEYDEENYILYLNGVDWTGDILFNVDLMDYTIVVSGNNILNGTITAFGSLYIRGDGTLTINSTLDYAINSSILFNSTVENLIINTTSDNSSGIIVPDTSSSLIIGGGHINITSKGPAIKINENNQGNINFNAGYLELSSSSVAIDNGISSTIYINGSIIKTQAPISINNPNLYIESGVLYSTSTDKFVSKTSTSTVPSGDGTPTGETGNNPIIFLSAGYRLYQLSNETITPVTELSSDGTTLSYDSTLESYKNVVISKGIYNTYEATNETLDSIVIISYLSSDLSTSIKNSYILSHVVGSISIQGPTAISDKYFTTRQFLIEPPAPLETIFTYDGFSHDLGISSSEYYEYIDTFTTEITDVGELDLYIALTQEEYYWSDTLDKDVKEFTIEVLPYEVEFIYPYEYSFTYDGYSHSLDIEDSLYYTIYDNERIEIGESIVTIELNDKTNYIFKNSDSQDITLSLIIVENTTPSYVYINYVYDQIIISDITNPNEEDLDTSENYTFSPLSHPLINFLGWYLDNDYTVPIQTLDDLLSSALIDYSVRLYAKIEYLDFEIILDYSGLTYKKNEYISLGRFSPNSKSTINISDYVPNVKGYNYNGFIIGDKKYIYNIDIDENILNNVTSSKAILNATYSYDVSMGDEKNASIIEFYNIDKNPTYLSHDLVNITMEESEKLSKDVIDRNKDAIIDALYQDYYYEEILFEPLKTYKFNISPSNETNSLLKKLIIPIKDIESYFTRYVIKSGEDYIDGYRCDKFGNYDKNGKYLTFMAPQLDELNIIGVKFYIETPWMHHEVMSFIYNNGNMPESFEWFIRDMNYGDFIASFDYDYSPGEHFYTLKPKCGYYYLDDIYSHSKEITYIDGINDTITASYKILKQYTLDELDELHKLTQDDFKISFSSISLKSEYLDLILLDNYDDLFATYTSSYNYIPNNIITSLDENTEYNFLIRYYFRETDSYMSTDYYEVTISFRTKSLDEFIQEINNNIDKYPKEFTDFLNDLPVDFPKDALDRIITTYEKLDSYKLDQENKYYKDVNDYIEAKKIEIINDISIMTYEYEIDNYLYDVEYNTIQYVRRIRDSVASANENVIINIDISDSIKDKYDDYIDKLIDKLFKENDELTNEEIASRATFISDSAKTLSDLSDIYKNNIEDSNFIESQKTLGDSIKNLYDSKVDELMSEEYLFNLSTADFSRFYDYVDMSIKSAKTFVNLIRNCDGINSRFMVNVNLNIKKIEIITFRDFNKDEMDEIFYKDADELMYYHIQDLMESYLESWFEEIKESNSYSHAKLKRIEKEYLKYLEIIRNDETFRPLYNEARRQVEEIDGYNSDLETLSNELKKMNNTESFILPSNRGFKGIDALIITLTSILVISFSLLFILKRKGVSI